MKFDRRSPASWLVFAAVATAMAIALAVRALLVLTGRARPQRRRLVLFSHVPSGNVRAFGQRMPEQFRRGWDVRYLHIGREQFRRRADMPGVVDLLAANPAHMLWVIRSDVIMCTHGPGLLKPLQAACHDLRFVDVWHGVGFVDRRRYVKEVRSFARLLQPSAWTARFVTDLGIDQRQIEVTGHALWDVLLDPTTAEQARLDLGVRHDRPVVLVAPTWTHGRLWEQRDTFGDSWDDIAMALDEWAAERDVHVLFRSHLNAGAGIDRPLRHVMNVPFAEFPDTASVLSVTDVLVTDWSSIGNDFLPTGRPIVYLDVPPPFVVGHLSTDDRPGDAVDSVDRLLAALSEAVQDPDRYLARHLAERARVAEKVHGGTADGHVVDRYADALERLVPPR